MNKWDFQVACSKALTAVLVIPWLLAYHGSRLLSLLAFMAERGYRTIEKANDGTRRWANPDIYGKAPKRARKLLYRRHTVE